MNIGLYRAATSMRANHSRLDAISSNLANVDTPGYKRRGTATFAFEARTAGGPSRGIATRSSVDWGQGVLDRTENVYDLALYGDGFFAIDSPAGEVYSREGGFKIDANGVLQTAEGYPVAWERLTGAIDPRGLPVVVDGEGNVRQGESDLGRLRLVAFEDKGRLEQNADGFWEAPPSLKQKAHTAVVHQGALERSNSVALEEVVTMIALQRSFDSSSRVMSSISKSYEKLTQVR